MKSTVEEKRKQRGFTQQQVASKVGISRQYYNDLENFKRYPSVTVAKKIGKLLKIDWTIFFA